MSLWKWRRNKVGWRGIVERSRECLQRFWKKLSFVYQSPLLPALDLVDHRNVSHMTSPSGRSVYQVIGSSGTPYTCFTTSLYCSCPAFRYSVLMKDDHLMCKHVLAIKLSEAMKLTKTLEVTDDEMATLLKTIE
ncbi:zinc finger SWIM domain-containing protein 7-like isoform X4 [Mytilus californianus]|uniref:zinc finger SWIM domain-containing protein 7-like isoform X4 n=1 Tax=Mytilus californianus TaxID=6549 RepID=UPI00224510A0|nr:zinc finger SWIM domain-containing protein 7-like isoform X4 [Mytilus californianus]